MLHAKFQDHRNFGPREDFSKFLLFFYIYGHGMVAILVM